jgi:hypothetical protein
MPTITKDNRFQTTIAMDKETYKQAECMAKDMGICFGALLRVAVRERAVQASRRTAATLLKAREQQMPFCCSRKSYFLNRGS